MPTKTVDKEFTTLDRDKSRVMDNIKADNVVKKSDLDDEYKLKGGTGRKSTLDEEPVDDNEQSLAGQAYLAPFVAPLYVYLNAYDDYEDSMFAKKTALKAFSLQFCFLLLYTPLVLFLLGWQLALVIVGLYALMSLFGRKKAVSGGEIWNPVASYFF